MTEDVFFFNVAVNDNDDGDVRQESMTASDGLQWFRRRVSALDKFRLNHDGRGLRKHMIRDRFSYGSNGSNSVKPESTRINIGNSVNSLQFSQGSVRSWIHFGSDSVSVDSVKLSQLS
ncbi:hypothetical protein Hanom_Chr02g00113811 [Helianthus anomalus]